MKQNLNSSLNLYEIEIEVERVEEFLFFDIILSLFFNDFI